MLPVEETRTPIASARRSHPVRVRVDDQRLFIDAVASEIVRDIRTARWTIEGIHPAGYQLRRYDVPLLHSRSVPNAGLEPVVHDAVQRAGYIVESGFSRTWPRVLTYRDWAPLPGQPPLDGRYLHRVLLRRDFLVRYSRDGVDPAWLIAQVGLAFPDARLGVLTATRADAKQYATRLRRWLSDVAITSLRFPPDRKPRIAVGTMGGMGHFIVEAWNIDVLFVPDARHALLWHSQTVLLAAHSRFNVVGFLPDDVHVPRFDWRRVGTAFGPYETKIPRHGCYSLPVNVVWQSLRGSTRPGQANDYRLKRDGYARHPVRNRRLACLANALVRGDASAINRLCPALGRALGSFDNLQVVLVTETVDHALTLAERLPGWWLMMDSNVVADGLSAAGALRIGQRLMTGPSCRPLLATAAALKWIDLATVDVLLWAGGGPTIPPLPAHRMAVPEGQDRRLIIVDVVDNHHPRLARWSRQRRRDYEATGWHAPGVNPIEAAVRRFYADQERLMERGDV
jgi:hypothetical protein